MLKRNNLGSKYDYALSDRRSVSAQLRGHGDRREAAYIRLLERSLKACPGTDLSAVIQEFEQRRRRWDKVGHCMRAAKSLPVVGAVLELKCLLSFAAGAGLAWLACWLWAPAG